MTDIAGISREERHFRSIDIRGYRRSDGLFEVVGQLSDRKPAGYVSPARGPLDAGKPLHDMGIRLVFGRDMVVRAVEAFINEAPYGPCPGGGAALQVIVGTRIGKGWMVLLRERLRPSESCAHLRELLGPMATTAIQTMAEQRPPGETPVDAEGRPTMIDSCYAYASQREVVLERWPRWHTR